VRSNVKPYSIVIGNPAKVVKMRFDDKAIKMLLKIKWWDWDIKKVTRNLDIIYSGDVKKLKKCV
jgi:virginiamycin A acetyltransferase